MSRITILYELEDILNTLGTLFLFIKANYLGLHIFRDVFCLYNADNVGHGQSLFREKERICKLYSCNWLFCWQSDIRTNSYGYPGCMVLLAAMMLHYCICGALFRPLSVLSKSRTGNWNRKSVG